MMTGTPGNSGPAINAIIWTLLILAMTAVGLRIHARTRRQRQLDWDDYLMTLALVLEFLPSVVCR